MKKILKKIFVTLIFFYCIFFAIIALNKSYADYGDFESYDSGSSSSWDSGSSYDWDDDDDDYSSSYDDDRSRYSSSSSSSSSSGSSSSDSDVNFVWDENDKNKFYNDYFSEITFYIVLAFAFIIIFSFGASKITEKLFSNINKFSNFNINPNMYYMDENRIIEEIQKKDPNFNKTDFLGWAGDLFIKMQYAWSKRNIDNLRAYETPDLFEQTLAQVKQYIDNGRINKMERVCVLNSRLVDYHANGNIENLSITITAKMTDYIIDEKTNNVLKGDPNVEKTNTYRLTFMRSADNIQNNDKVTTTMNCPNCGAPTEITSSGKCPYCGSIIVTRKYSWTLSKIEKIY